MSDDLIRRSDAIEAVAFWYEDFNGCDGNYFAHKCLETLPSADRPQGEWKRRLVDNGFNADWICSECGYRVKTDFVSFNYCPNCGCRMKGKGDSNKTHEVVANGNCAICGKTLSGDRVFVCKECADKGKDERRGQ